MRTIVLLCVGGYAHAAHRQLYHISPSPSPPPATPPFDALSQCTAVIDLGCYGTAEYQCRSSILALLEFIGGTPSSCVAPYLSTLLNNYLSDQCTAVP